MRFVFRALLVASIACLTTAACTESTDEMQNQAPANLGSSNAAPASFPANAQWLEAVENPPRAKSEWEEKALAVIEEMDGNPRRRYRSVTPEDGRTLRALVESLDAQRVVEVGTSVGYSDLWIALALRTTGGSLTTYEIEPKLARIAAKNLELAGLDDLVTIVVGDAHQRVKEYEGSIDVLFIDADKQGYVDYLRKLLPKVRPGGLILAHNPANLRNAPGYIEAVTENADLDTSFLFMGQKGLALTLKKR